MSGEQIVSRHGVDLKAFREEIVPAAEPVVLEDLVKDWPAVQAGLQSARALGDFNVLANYWWNDARQAGSPFDWDGTNGARSGSKPV